MTVSADKVRAGPYVGSGTTGPFVVDFYFLEDDDLLVLKETIATGVFTTLALTTDYTVSGAGVASGGSVTLISSLSSSYRLHIIRDPDRLQSTAYPANDKFPSASHERALDKVAMLVQRVFDKFSRAIKAPDTNSTDVVFSGADWANRATKGLKFDAGGAITITTTDPDVAIAAAAASATAAAGSATAAASSASAAATSATAASGSATSSASSATAAAASATAAAAAVNSVAFRDVVFITFADSPYTITSAHRGKLISVDTSGGAVSITLPQISGLDLTTAFMLGIKKSDSSGNSITINRSGTDLIDSATSKVLSAAGAGTTLIPDTDPAPDKWTSADFGASAGNMTVDVFSGNGSTVAFTLSVDPGSKNNTIVTISGVVQQKSSYTVSGTTLTFDAAPPFGSSNIEVVSGTTLSVGTPSDGSVTGVKLGAMTSAQLASALTDETGSGAAVFGTSPTIATPTISGAASFTGVPVLTGGAIHFPATQVPSSDPNDLDDYEEGTFTLTGWVSDASFGGSVSNQTGSYIKVGRQVTITGKFDVTAGTSTRNVGHFTGGVPFARDISGHAYYVGTADYGGNNSQGAACTNAGGASTTYFFLYNNAFDGSGSVVYTQCYRATA